VKLFVFEPQKHKTEGTRYISRKNFWVCPFRSDRRICERIKIEPYHLLE
jgi:hypothetical protein